MPYISVRRRKDLADGDELRTTGDLNYTLTRAVIDWVDEQPDDEINYKLLESVVRSIVRAQEEVSQRIGYAFDKLCCRLVKICDDNARMLVSQNATASATLECVKLEFYRRVIVPFEDRKMSENGDVYTQSPVEVQRITGDDVADLIGVLPNA